MPIRSRLTTVLACAAALGLSASAGAVNLNGTWVGSFSCQEFNGVNLKYSVKDSTLLISQAENESVLSAHIDTETPLVYNGIVIDDEQDPEGKGNLVMNQCGTDPFPAEGLEGEIVRLAIKVNAAKGTGTLKGVGIAEYADKTLRGVLTCKFKYKRVNTTPAKFNGCAPL